MEALAEPSPASDQIILRGTAIFRERQKDVQVRTDRMFANLMIVQWIVGVAASVWISPRAWEGLGSPIHWHVWVAVFLGGAATGLPVYLARSQPGVATTRQTVAVGQVLSSALLVHLTGGRIETHFHIFGSLAFLAFYRDWKVLGTATGLIILDHLVRGAVWPQSIFGVAQASHWRWLEHTGWLVFEDSFLLLSIRHSLRESRLIADRQARLEQMNRLIGEKVEDRTRRLQEEINERVRLTRQLVESSRRAGMAEVATGVLHNVGNVLNSVNVSCRLLGTRLRKSRAPGLQKVAALLREKADDLPNFLSRDAQAEKLTHYLDELADQLTEDREAMAEEVGTLAKNIDHIKEIVARQQTYARISYMPETFQVSDLLSDALNMSMHELAQHSIEVIRQLEDIPPISGDKHKVLQILVNFIRNAMQACVASDKADRRITVRTRHREGWVEVAVMDNGIGIPQANLTRIFSHGFTTRRGGHGFGLHAGANAAQGMGAKVRVHSAGPGQGSTFMLELPTHPTDRKLRPSSHEEAL